MGAVTNQRPDLFGATIPAVGVMDMLRFHEFTAGRFWVDDYGSSEDPQEFEALLAYSPYHNLHEGTTYPATLVTTGDHDDRVVPAHSFKYAATLQEKYSGKNPVMIRIKMDDHAAGVTPAAKGRCVNPHLGGPAIGAGRDLCGESSRPSPVARSTS